MSKHTVYRTSGAAGDIVVTWDSEYREFCVHRRGAKRGEGYFTDDKDDAIATADDMAEHYHEEFGDAGFMENPGAAMPQVFTYTDSYKLLDNTRRRRRHPDARGGWSLGANTTIREEDGDVVIRLYATDILRYRPDDTIVVSTGGHHTRTTLARINAFLSPKARVYSKRGRLFMESASGVYPFTDGTVLASARGRAYNANPFMERQVFQNDGWVIEFDGGESVASPDFDAPDIDDLRNIIGTGRKVHIGDAYGRVEAVTYLPKNTWWGRLSAPGYMDATDYVYGNSRREVEEMLSDMYGDEDDGDDE